MHIAGIGGLGLAASGVITHVIDKIKNWKKKKTGDDVELDEPEKTESEPEKTEDESKVSKENKKELEDYSKEELIDIIKKQAEKLEKLEEKFDKQVQMTEEYKKMVDELKVGIKSTGTKDENKEIKEGSPDSLAKLVEQYKNLSPEQQQIVAERFEQEQGKRL